METAQAIPQHANRKVEPFKSRMYQVLTRENETKESENVNIFGKVNPRIGSCSHLESRTEECFTAEVPLSDPFVDRMLENGPLDPGENCSAGVTKTGSRMDAVSETIE